MTSRIWRWIEQRLRRPNEPSPVLGTPRLNRVYLVGRLVGRPEIYEGPRRGGAFLSLAERFDNGAVQYHSVFVEGMGRKEASRLVVGHFLLAEGVVRTRRWTTPRGHRQLRTYILVERLTRVRTSGPDTSLTKLLHGVPRSRGANQQTRQLG